MEESFERGFWSSQDTKRGDTLGKQIRHHEEQPGAGKHGVSKVCTNKGRTKQLVVFSTSAQALSRAGVFELLLCIPARFHTCLLTSNNKYLLVCTSSRSQPGFVKQGPVACESGKIAQLSSHLTQFLTTIVVQASHKTPHTALLSARPSCCKITVVSDRK